MARLLSLAAGRRTRWLVVLAWILIGGVAGSFAGRFEEAQKNEPSSFLPGKAESVEALEQLKRFPSGEVTPAVAVYRRGSGLTPADRAKITRDRAELNADRPQGAAPVGPPVVSPDGRAALLVMPISARGEAGVLGDAVDAMRRQVGDGGGSLDVKVTGPAGYSADAIDVFEQINGTLLIATATLVFVLLILIYRSPIFWAIPFFTVLFAEVASRGIGYGLAKAGVTINGQTAGILAVLVFGAGTDYALLLVARYREELRHHEDKLDAVRIALRRAGPAVFASALTVMAALLCLLPAELNGTRGLGPVGAIGIGLAMLATLTLLPALLAIFGRRAFWPFIPRYGSEGSDETHGVWRRVGDAIRARPRRVWLGAVTVLAVLALGLTYANDDLTSGDGYIGTPDSVKGQRLIARSFPAGAAAPASVIAPAPGKAAEVSRALTGLPQVARVRAVERGAPGVHLEAVLEEPPYSQAAFDSIPAIRRAAKAAGGAQVLVGGPSAEEHDTRVSATRDNRVIVPLVILAVLVILGVLLRAVVAPLVLIATVIASYAAALGIGFFFFEHVFGFAGADPSIPLFTFIFLVALGVDYNIFLMARVREEAQRRGTEEGMVRGLAVTGAVITSAGIVLAGTFATLAVLPLVVLTEIGFTIAVGVLLDTFLVRSLLVPALVMDIGARVWWPSALARGRSSRPPSAPTDAPAASPRVPAPSGRDGP